MMDLGSSDEGGLPGSTFAFHVRLGLRSRGLGLLGVKFQSRSLPTGAALSTRCLVGWLPKI